MKQLHAAEKPLRVAFVDYVLEPEKPGRSGLSDIVWDMAGELANQGHEAHVIASYHTTTYPDPRVVVHNFPTPPIGYRNILGQLWILRRAARIASELRPDIIHAPEYVSTAVFVALGVPAPLVLTVPGNVFHRIQHGHSYEWHYLEILKWAARVSARRCARVISVSQEMKRWWERTGSSPERTPWIPYGVNQHRFRQVPDARERLGIAHNCVLLLYVGRFAKEKGLFDLLESCSSIRDLLKPGEVQIVLVGKGPQADEMQRRIDAENLNQVVQIRPWIAQDELSTWYSAADALLLPSHSEAFSRTILEAMICGTLVIGSRITGTEDHIRDGVNGLLFPPGDTQALADILADVVRCPDRLRDMRMASLAYAQEHLTLDHIMRRIIREVYMPIVGSNA
jgi:glycosyltransferase involved in cell wall biosynthesis